MQELYRKQLRLVLKGYNGMDDINELTGAHMRILEKSRGGIYKQINLEEAERRLNELTRWMDANFGRFYEQLAKRCVIVENFNNLFMSTTLMSPTSEFPNVVKKWPKQQIITVIVENNSNYSHNSGKLVEIW